MVKTTIREILGSLGRYLAIFAIVMLGVGFFAGLKVTKPAMVATEDDYLRKQNFYDFQLLSTIGFTEEDVEKLAQMEEVTGAEGSICADALCKIGDGGESVYKICQMPKTINQVVLEAGRMPGKEDECLLDVNVAGASSLGAQIKITENNTEDTLDYFRVKTYTVTGVVRSPLYMNFERGTTSLGEGKITGFFYVPGEAFDCDYLTEIYLTAGQGHTVYTDAYKDEIDEMQPIIEDKTKELAQKRYDGLIADAQDEINDAQKELDDKKEEAEEELGKALSDIRDGEEEIETHETEIADGKEEIEEAKKKLKNQEAELKEQETKLNEQEAALKEQEAGLKEQKAGLAAMKAMLPPVQYQASLQQIEAGLQQIQAGLLQIEAGQQQISEGKKQLASAKQTLKEKEQELLEGEEELQKAKEDLEKGKADYEEARITFEEETADAQKKIDDARQKMEEIEEPDTYVLTRNTNIGYACFESDSNIVAAIADVFPVFFFLVAALNCMTTMNRMVEEQRTQIGVLKALGFGSGAIMGKYTFYAGSAALLGGIAGYAGGTVLFPEVIWAAYGIMYDIGKLIYSFDPLLAVSSVATALLCSVGTAYFSCRYELADAPANLIRPKAPKSGKRIFLEKIPFLWNPMKFLHKVSLRNLFRYKKRFFMMILGISGCTALLVTGFGLKDSITDIADRQYNEVQIYDIGISFSRAPDAEEKEVFAKETADLLAKTAFRYEESVDMDFGGKTKSLYLEVPENVEEISAFLDLHTSDGRKIPYPKEGEAILTEKVAQNMGIKEGDTVLLRDNDMRQMSVKVTALCENYVYNYVYVNQETYQKQIGEMPEFKSAYALVKEGKDVHECAAFVSDREHVLAASATMDMRERIGNMMASMNYIVLLVIFSAGSLAFIVLYNLTNINITERIREIATIKVLGFYAKETADYVFRENLLLTGMGAAAGLLLGKWLHRFVMHNINIDMVSFKTYISPASYMWSILLTFAFALLINGLMSFKLEKINMAESLKSVE